MILRWLLDLASGKGLAHPSRTTPYRVAGFDQLGPEQLLGRDRLFLGWVFRKVAIQILAKPQSVLLDLFRGGAPTRQVFREAVFGRQSGFTHVYVRKIGIFTGADRIGQFDHVHTAVVISTPNYRSKSQGPITV